MPYLGFSAKNDITINATSDLDLTSDSTTIKFGADDDVTITHDPDDGLIFKSIATADDNPFLLTIQTGETDLAANDVIGKIQFQAPDEGTGTDANLVSAAIQAVAEGDFSSSSNATSLQFMTGSSEAATTKMTILSSGNVEITNGLDVGTITTSTLASLRLKTAGSNNAVALNIEENSGNEGWGLGVNANGDLKFYNSGTGTSTGNSAVTFSDDNKVGIGTASPSDDLHIASSVATIRLEDNDVANGEAYSKIFTHSHGGIEFSADPDGNRSSTDIRFTVDGSETARIDSSGNLLVGTTASTAYNNSSDVYGFNVYANGQIASSVNAAQAAYFNRQNSDGTIVDLRKDGTTVGSIGVADSGDRIYLGGSGANRGIAIDSSASVVIPSTNTGGLADALIGLGTSTARFTELFLSSSLRLTDSSNTHKYSITSLSSDALQFYDTTAGAERMRIDSSGNLLVGKTSSATNTVGIEIDGANGVGVFTRDGNAAIEVNRKTSDGTIINLRKDGSTVGGIGAKAGDFVVGSSSGSDAAFRMDGTNNQIYASDTTGAARDNAINLGASTVRWKDLYLSGGVYVGGTGSANHLDDYEEGVFTPALSINDSTSGITYLSRSAEYVKIGKLVFVNGDIQLSSKGSSSGVVKITSLPFTINDRTAGTALDGGASLCAFSSGTSGIHTAIGLMGGGGTTALSMYVATSSDSQMNDQLGSSNITDSFSVRFSLTYIT